jgi:hypothetical protein
MVGKAGSPPLFWEHKVQNSKYKAQFTSVAG